MLSCKPEFANNSFPEASLDPIDAKLLNLLQEDCSRSLSELGRLVGLSISGVKERLRKLRAGGDVRAYVALVRPQTLGYRVCAFVHVQLKGGAYESRFLNHVTAMPDVQEVHCISGDFPYLLKVWASDLEGLEELLNKQIKSCPGVIRTQTTVVLSSPKHAVTGLSVRA